MIEHIARFLTTAMELTANRRPFIYFYFPLKHHFEQNFHVRHRLERHRGGRRMDFDHSPPDAIAAAILRRSAATSATARSRPTERPAQLPSSPRCCDKPREA